MADYSDLRRELARLLNSHSMENQSNTPDYLLASFLVDCLKAWDYHTRERDRQWRNVLLTAESEVNRD